MALSDMAVSSWLLCFDRLAGLDGAARESYDAQLRLDWAAEYRWHFLAGARRCGLSPEDAEDWCMRLLPDAYQAATYSEPCEPLEIALEDLDIVIAKP